MTFLEGFGLQKQSDYCGVWAKSDESGWCFVGCELDPGHDGNHRNGDLEWEGTPSYDLGVTLEDGTIRHSQIVL